MLLRIRLVYAHCVSGNVVHSVGTEVFIFFFCTDYTVLHDLSKSHWLYIVKTRFFMATICAMLHDGLISTGGIFYLVYH